MTQNPFPPSPPKLPQTTPQSPSMALHDEPGHLIRRAQQIAVSRFHEVHGRHVTPIQYAILRTLDEAPGIDQVTLAQRVALDTSTTADIATRLEKKGWIVRELLPRRQRALRLTDAGRQVLDDLLPHVNAMNALLLQGLDAQEQEAFVRLLRKFVHLANESDTPPQG